ncbi:MAG: hypothetical protein GX683_02560 [Ruminococcaceae bacterium]|nr:hypothetical protein [Oscillospiraceae bacterium]
MIEIKMVREGDGAGVTLKAGELCYIARDGGEELGRCIFSFDGEAVRLIDLSTKNKDYAIADGLARSAVASLFDLAKTVVIDGEGEELTKFRDVSRLFEGNSTKIESFAKTCC